MYSIYFSLFGFPDHYTDIGNICPTKRLKILAKSWSVPVIKKILEPLKKFFVCDDVPNEISSTDERNQQQINHEIAQNKENDHSGNMEEIQQAGDQSVGSIDDGCGDEKSKSQYIKETIDQTVCNQQLKHQDHIVNEKIAADKPGSNEKAKGGEKIIENIENGDGKDDQEKTGNYEQETTITPLVDAYKSIKPDKKTNISNMDDAEMAVNHPHIHQGVSDHASKEYKVHQDKINLDQKPENDDEHVNNNHEKNCNVRPCTRNRKRRMARKIRKSKRLQINTFYQRDNIMKRKKTKRVVTKKVMLKRNKQYMNNFDRYSCEASDELSSSSSQITVLYRDNEYTDPYHGVRVDTHEKKDTFVRTHANMCHDKLFQDTCEMESKRMDTWWCDDDGETEAYSDDSINGHHHMDASSYNTAPIDRCINRHPSQIDDTIFIPCRQANNDIYMPSVHMNNTMGMPITPYYTGQYNSQVSVIVPTLNKYMPYSQDTHTNMDHNTINYSMRPTVHPLYPPENFHNFNMMTYRDGTTSIWDVPKANHYSVELQGCTDDPRYVFQDDELAPHHTTSKLDWSKSVGTSITIDKTQNWKYTKKQDTFNDSRIPYNQMMSNGCSNTYGAYDQETYDDPFKTHRQNNIIPSPPDHTIHHQSYLPIMNEFFLDNEQMTNASNDRKHKPMEHQAGSDTSFDRSHTDHTYSISESTDPLDQLAHIVQILNAN